MVPRKPTMQHPIANYCPAQVHRDDLLARAEADRQRAAHAGDAHQAGRRGGGQSSGGACRQCPGEAGADEETGGSRS
jgi:hypothetical protein